MSFRVNEQITAAVFIGGREFPLDHGNSMRSLHLRASSLGSLPELQITLVDILNQMPNYALQDGAQITLQINGSVNLTRNFRVFRWRRDPAPQGFVFTIECVWDAPRYWLGTSNAGMKASGSQVLQALASQSGLGWWSKNDNTSDTMLWLQGNKTGAEFAKHIARCGYISDTSHMGLAIDSVGQMRYVDINRIPKPKVTVGYTPSPDASQFQMITDFTPKTMSGVNNALGGYMHSRHVQVVSGDGATVDSLENELDFTPDSKYPLLSPEVREKMERGGISFGPLDFGNVHKNYERGRYQNARYNLLNSLTGEFLFPFQTSWEPFDNFSLALPADADSSQYNGEYTAHTKIILIQGSSYNEQIIAVKNGLGA